MKIFDFFRRNRNPSEAVQDPSDILNAPTIDPVPDPSDILNAPTIDPVPDPSDFLDFPAVEAMPDPKAQCDNLHEQPDPERRSRQCSNCHEQLDPEDRYCRFCGTKIDRGAYDPYSEVLYVEELYGPMPVKRTHVCKQCGYAWVTCLMFDDERYCPRCRGEAPYSESDS